MTSDDIIRLMQESCDKDKVDAWHNDFWTITQEELERFAALVAEAEREACAKACEAEGERFKHHPSGRRDFSICAAAIRARGEQEQPR